MWPHVRAAPPPRLIYSTPVVAEGATLTELHLVHPAGIAPFPTARQPVWGRVGGWGVAVGRYFAYPLP